MPDPIELSKKYEGKIEIYPKIPITSYDDFALIYTPGVAKVSEAIYREPEKSFDLTSKWNTIGIITDGTRVLGLGKIGPEAAMPVMEGKALLFKYLGGVDAIPLPINVKSADDFVNVVKALEPSLGGINLEDIESPKCFYILEKLQSSLNIPVWHDDQQGTAGAILAGLINAMILTNKDPKESKVVLYGAGASNITTARILSKYGFKTENMVVIDSKGPLYADREDVDHLMLHHKWKYELAIKTNKWEVKEINDAFKDADVVIAASKPGPDAIKKDWISLMNKDPIVFALANPVPEILPQDAKEVGAKIVATGRSDFPNQVNNSLIFPAMFRGVLDSRAKAITDDMIITASEALAKYARNKGINENYIIPRMDEWEAYYEEAAEVASKAVELGLARIKKSKEEFREIAKQRILRARKIMSLVVSTWSP
ncbi:NADP-dependent malic enzyme [Acidianus sp. HS-5]|uniref:NAD(P)-dependent malic enzyme n=1 Tax=Acidianus sp. HS-5 TaxID=2886040 RepID=UPI001F3E0FAD|nr:NADP-dependent malic enzyme [Acidianus sp. HS-5]BDC18828.1 malate dehydrogenase [Acidianus sp. HS-5]